MSEHVEQLLSRLESKDAVIGILGMGYVGYPMAQLAAEQGFHVIGVEIDSARVEQINQGKSYIQDVPTEAVAPLVEKGFLRATTDYSEMRKADVVLITVPTPLVKTGDPDMGYVINALESLKPFMHPEMLIVLESTTYPGTTEELFKPAVEEAGYEVGTHIFIGFSPERIDPGNATYGPRNTPKVIGGVTENCTRVGEAFYSQITNKVVPLSSTTAAEMVKLYENTFRAINIGLVNELAIICNLLQVNVWEIIDAAATKPFGFMPFYPGPGLGGHCIPVDPSYLAWKMRSLEYKTRFIDLATDINTKMPEWVVSRASTLLNDHAKPVRNSKILLLGLAYKNDIDDLRESPALDVFSLLRARGADVTYHDPYCPKVKLDGTGLVYSVDLTAEVLQEQDLVIITTNHRKNVDYDLVVEHSKLVFDTRNTLRDHPAMGYDKVVLL
ncbi:nucleotide sugar dehydrogenase [bacterium]|nr:nucleotide sugar dehydrogenase [bacterium]